MTRHPQTRPKSMQFKHKLESNENSMTRKCHNEKYRFIFNTINIIDLYKKNKVNFHEYTAKEIIIIFII